MIVAPFALCAGIVYLPSSTEAAVVQFAFVNQPANVYPVFTVAPRVAVVPNVYVLAPVTVPPTFVESTVPLDFVTTVRANVYSSATYFATSSYVPDAEPSAGILKLYVSVAPVILLPEVNQPSK